MNRATSATSRDITVGTVILVTNTRGSNVSGSLLWAVSQADGGSVINFDLDLTTMTGTVSCPRAGDQFGVVVDLEQTQKAGKNTTVVRGTGSVGITCSTTAQPWSAAVEALDDGVFATVQASAAALTNNTPVWVTRANTSRTIKLVRPPRR